MRFPFFSRQTKLNKAPRRNLSSRQIGRGFEQLEDRRLLATISVTLASDAASPADDGEITLREAITYVNTQVVPPNDLATINGNLGTNDKIVFDPSVFASPQTITLTAGELAITNSVIIDASMLTSLTIDASGNDNNVNVDNGGGSRIFNIFRTSPSNTQPLSV